MTDAPKTAPIADSSPRLARQLGLFDASMVVMGGIVGSGIFMNPYVVAQQVHTAGMILGAWALGGVVGLIGAFIWAELAATLPEVGGQYAYLREAFHPAVAFLYGWVLLLVIQTGGMAAVTITFARYFIQFTGIPAHDWLVGSAALVLLALINCFGVKAGGRTQSALMTMKIGAIVVLILAGVAFTKPSLGRSNLSEPPASIASFGAAMVPVLFAYGGWQTASFIAAEVKDSKRNLPRALVIGVGIVVALYTLVNWACVRALGAAGLATTETPATSVMQMAFGRRGSVFIAAAIAISTLGFLSQSILTAPRVYFAMARDGLFFRAVGSLDSRTRVPVVAIALQTVWTIVISVTGRYEQILNYVVAMDFLFFGLTAITLFAFRRRPRAATGTLFRTPGHPVTTTIFSVICWAVVANTIYRYPRNTLVGFALLLAGVPVYLLWNRRARISFATGTQP